VNDTVQLVAPGHFRERTVHHPPGQPAQPLARAFQEESPRLRIPPAQAIDQILKLSSPVIVHASILSCLNARVALLG
jgi:hypothetical protein